MNDHDLADFAEERRRMVETQLVPRGISDEAVLEAFRVVPRDLFIPPGQRGHAYEDRPLSIGSGQTISQPYIVALMSELLGLPHGERRDVLEVGAGSGYQSAILAAMGHRVVAVERIEKLAKDAERNLRKAGYGDCVDVQLGDGTLGWEFDAPYDGVLVAAAAPAVPKALKRQLKVGGVLVLPVGDRFIQTMLRVTRVSGDEFKEENGVGCRFVPLIGEDGFS